MPIRVAPFGAHGSVVGAQTEHAMFTLLRFMSSHALSFPPCSTPSRKAMLTPPGRMSGLIPDVGIGMGWEIRPSFTCRSASDQRGFVFVARARRPFTEAGLRIRPEGRCDTGGFQLFRLQWGKVFSGKDTIQGETENELLYPMLTVESITMHYLRNRHCF